MTLRVGDTDRHQFVLNAVDNTYYADLSFAKLGVSQAFLEVDYGEGQLDVQTLSGMFAAKDVDAVRTVALVLLLIVVTAEVMFAAVAAVPAVMFAAREVEALSILVFAVFMFVFAVAKVAPSDVLARLVFALTAVVTAAIFDESEVEAARIAAFVFALIPVPTPAIEAPRDVLALSTLVFVVLMFVFAVARVAPSDVEAFEILVPFAVTLVLIVAKVAPSEVLAVVMSVTLAREPLVRVASVRFRVANDQTCDAVRDEEFVASCIPIDPGVVRVEVAIFHTSEARVPKVVSVRVADVQTLSGMFAAKDVDAVRTVALVLLLIVVTAEVMFAAVAAVPAVMFAAREVEALSILVFAVFMFVFAVAKVAPSDVLARLVFALTAVVTAAIFDESEVEAARIAAFVFALIPVPTPAIEAPRDVLALSTLVFVVLT
jgi:hypothetical protein